MVGWKCLKPRVLLPIIGIGLLFYVYTKIFAEPKPWYYYPAQCSYSDIQVNDTVSLAAVAESILKEYDLDHFLCYGSLWGALRIERLLPWDKDVDFCVLNPPSERKLFSVKRAFKSAEVAMEFDNDEGVYFLTKGLGRARFVMFDLVEDFTSLRRSGVKFKSLRKSVTEFPSSLIAPPLPRKRFHSLTLPVPRGDIEIQKYFYPNDWWLEVKPPGC